jgi:hypothetical protein
MRSVPLPTRYLKFKTSGKAKEILAQLRERRPRVAR